MEDQNAEISPVGGLVESIVGQFIRRSGVNFSGRQNDKGWVWHYTSLDSFLGMLGISPSVALSPFFYGEHSFRRLWATSSDRLNDSQEFEFGRVLLFDKLGEPQEASLDANRKSIYAALKDAASGADGSEAFATSFSFHGDDLGQWRAYADDGRGVAIAFGAPDLGKWANGIGAWVTYEEARQSQLIDLFVTLAVDALESMILQGLLNFERHRGEIVEALKTAVSLLALLVKNAAFSSEAEFRLIYTDGLARKLADRKVRLSAARVTPYVEITFDSPVTEISQWDLNDPATIGRADWYMPEAAPLREIRLGPGAQSEINLRTISSLMTRIGKPIHVSKSQIPYVPR